MLGHEPDGGASAEALLKKLPFWETLSDGEKRRTAEAAVLRRYPAGSLLHGNCDGGESCLGMVYLISGELRTCIVSGEGREITLFRLHSGDCCVFSAACIMSEIRLDTLLTADRDTDALIVPPEAFAALTRENLHVRCFLYELAAKRFSSSLRVMQELLFDSFDRRLASFLLEEYRRTGSPEIRMTQTEAARNVNSAREVVARTLKRFSEAGLVENRRGLILLRDTEGLERLARNG